MIEAKVPEVHIEPKIQRIELRVFSEVPSSVEPFMLLSAVSFLLCGVLIFTCIVLSLRLQRLEAYQGIDSVGKVIKSRIPTGGKTTRDSTTTSIRLLIPSTAE